MSDPGREGWQQIPLRRPLQESRSEMVAWASVGTEEVVTYAEEGRKAMRSVQM